MRPRGGESERQSSYLQFRWRFAMSQAPQREPFMQLNNLRSLAVKAAVVGALLIAAYVLLVHFSVISNVLPRVMSVGN